MAINICVAIALAFLTRTIYIRFGSSLANKSSFSRIFIPLTLTTLLIIGVVKSSLALSLGLVGALSIVRFRTAIKDPEELIYLLICIAIGLGLGAEQTKLTVAVVVVTLCVLMVNTYLSNRRSQRKGWYVVVRGDQKSVDETALMNEIKSTKTTADIKRLVRTQDRAEVCILIHNMSSDKLGTVRQKLSAVAPSAEVSMMEHQA